MELNAATVTVMAVHALLLSMGSITALILLVFPAAFEQFGLDVGLLAVLFNFVPATEYTVNARCCRQHYDCSTAGDSGGSLNS